MCERFLSVIALWFKQRDVEQFVVARREEAVAVADMVCLLAGEVGQDKRFETFFKEMTIAFNFADSLEDAKKDYLAGEVAIKPAQMRFAMARELCKHSVRCIAAHPKKWGFLTSLSAALFERHVLRKIMPSRRKASSAPKPAQSAARY